MSILFNKTVPINAVWAIRPWPFITAIIANVPSVQQLNRSKRLIIALLAAEKASYPSNASNEDAQNILLD